MKKRLNPKDLAQKLDHTLLRPEASDSDLVKLCQEAKTYKFATVCVSSANVAKAKKLLQGSGVKPIAVVGFPLGSTATRSKVFETQEAIQMGAKEIDMVLNVGEMKSRNYTAVLSDIQAVVTAAGKIPVKVILETALLSLEEKAIACALAKIAGAAFVKTSTGFASSGATEQDIAMMRKLVGPEMGVKASGGIRSRADAEKMIQAGANRLGTSASVAIVKGVLEEKKGY